MMQSRSFLDRSAAQKLVDPAIHRAVEFRTTSARIQTAHAESVGLGAIASDEDVNIDEIRRDALENTGSIALHEQQLLAQDDLRRQRQQMQHQLDEVLRGLSAKGTLPEVARSKDQIRAQRTACLQFLLDTNKHASEEERLNFPEHQTAAKQLGVLVANEARTEEHILWALGSEDAMIKDYWTVDELFEALVIARRVVDDVNRVKERNAEYWEMIQEGKTPFDNLYAKLSIDLEKIDQKADARGQDAAKVTKIIHDNLELVVASTGSNPKRKRPSAIDTTLANTDDASIAGPSTAPITKPSLVVALRLPRSFSFSQLSRPVQVPQLNTTSTNITASGQASPAQPTPSVPAQSPQDFDPDLRRGSVTSTRSMPVDFEQSAERPTKYVAPAKRGRGRPRQEPQPPQPAASSHTPGLRSPVRETRPNTAMAIRDDPRALPRDTPPPEAIPRIVPQMPQALQSQRSTLVSRDYRKMSQRELVSEPRMEFTWSSISIH
ncbi:unnamed protein product [Aureobasidium vineae]|uniref:Uncharacterized protein n=1 Tax=Aureobasidium vineae TaxID=2773715 RepID=A0A9N8PHE5_9PEZI|nr:unnamed protein product [Aureobasidium vineae]